MLNVLSRARTLLVNSRMIAAATVAMIQADHPPPLSLMLAYCRDKVVSLRGPAESLRHTVSNSLMSTAI